MVPGVIVPLAALPLTPNGKVDRKALPAPEDGALPRGTASAPPATPTEALLATIWAELLGVEQVGRHDNFFDLGGHSLLATQAVSRVRKAFQIELPLRALFDGPTIVELAAAIELVRREKDNAEAPPLIRARRSNRVPLSFAQERLWYLDQLEPNSPAYNIATAFRLQGALDVKALQAALQEMIYRHESLRTTIVIVDNRPVQVIGEDAAIVLRPINLTAIPKDEREAAVRRLVSEEAKRPFDLSQGPLIRATALQLASHEHVLLLTMHHIVSDGWSMGLFVKESVALYQAFTNGTQPSLPELPIQYADFALWQRQWLAGSVLDRQLAYWKETLAGIPPLLTLPTARPRPAAQTYRGARIPFKLSASLTQQLHALGQAEGATLFMTLLAAFQILLSRYSGQHDICVGVPIANRTRLEIEGLIGFFVNTLVLRTDVSGNPSCRTFLQRVRERVVAAQAHQDVPFEKVVEAVQPIRSLGHSPLFQVMFTFQNAPLEALEIPGLSIEALTIEDKTAKFDLSMELNETQEGLSGFVEYSTDLFDDDMMARMVEHYRVLLEQIAARPASRLSELSLLTEEERSTITGTWNETEAAYPADQSVADLFEAQAARTPGAVAVQCGPVAVTYAELEARAEQVAQGLVALGVGPDTIVAVLAERDVEWVTFVLGILKAGGAYLPLDPTHPAARRRQMLTQGQVRQLLTTEAARSRVGSLADEVPGLTIHTRASLPGDGSPRPRRRTHSKQAGYVLYTSGSTGLPKGAVVTQQGMVNNVWGKIPTLGLTDRDVVAQTAGVGFDISVWQVLSALLCGGRVAIIADEVVREPARLLAELARTGVTVAELVPSLLREVVAVESPVGVPALRWLLPTGEAVTPDLCRAWFARYPGIPLLNAYGPAECADDVAYHVLKAAPGAEERLVPIGRPAANLDLYVLDADLAAVPVGVTGEICIGGVGVGRGYLGEPERTAAAFVPHPYATTPGARLYRTGDLGRYRLDGTLEFHGRRDQQVKVRGFRIELGEIEAALAAVPGITDQVVVVREARAGQPQLVAYVVWADAAVAGATDLRAALRATLPEYMVPGVIVPLAALPLTPNGKVNRNALPAPEEGDLPRGTAYAPPETPAEELLATIWAELLGVPRVGRHDNFFDLGGDSILSIQVISRCRQSNIMLSPRHVIEHQTIAELAAKAAMERDCDIQAELGPVSGEVPLTPIQQWFFEQEILDPHYYNQAVLLEVRQDLTPAILESAFRHVLQQHDMLRARFRRDGEGWTQWIEPSVAPLAVHRVDLSHVSETDQEQLMVESAEEWHRRLHLSQGPLLQVVLFERGMSRSQRLLIIIHHAVVDWVSWRILVEDLQTACRQVMQGQPIQLPAKTSSYKQWAERLRIYAQSEEPAQDAVYWTDSRWAQAKEIPVDYPEGKRTNELTAAVTVELTAAETQALLQDVPRAYQSQITDVLLTAMVQSIGCWTGHSCLAVDLDRHGREDIFAGLDVSRTVGWFAGLFPVWLEVRPDAFPREAVRIVKEQLRLVPHQGIGYGVLKYLAPGGARSRQLRAMPAAQVCFNYLGQFDQTLPETGLFAAAAESSGRSQDGQDRLDHELSFTAAIIRGRLELSLTYGKERYRRATMETIVGVYVEILQDVIAHTGSRNPKSVLTPLAH
ncbi:MAG: amino acid adenylation domain-containing protein [Nitrospiraceae bacterium]